MARNDDRGTFIDTDTSARRGSGTDASSPGPVASADQRRPPAPRGAPGQPATERSGSAEVDAFLEHLKALAPVAAGGRGRLVFAMDATMSRRPTWDLALSLQGEMFSAVRDIGGLDVQLVFFRGLAECRASRWVGDPDELARLMRRVECHGGLTQVGRVLSHVRTETAERRVSALVYVGDCMEEEVDAVCAKVGELALLGVPAFMFQEGHDARASLAFAEIARLTRGAHCRFDAGSAAQLRALLGAVAVYAAGGRKALEALALENRDAGARLLLRHLKS